jgi:phage terminase large subunit
MIESRVLNISELINPHPVQKLFIQSVKKFKYILYGGAKGGGKSYILRWILIYLLLDFAANGYKNVMVGLFCEDYPSLKDRQVSKIKKEFPTWLGRLSNSDIYGLSFQLKEEYGGGVIALRNLDVPEKYASSEFAVVAVDEITKNKYDVFETLRSCCRYPGIENTKMLFGGNPGGVGHNWVKKLFIKKEFEPNEKESKLFEFVPAKVYDNPYQTETYINQLKSLNPTLRSAYLDGDWDIFRDIFFDLWTPKIHIIDKLPKDFELDTMRTGVDYGTTTVFENVRKWDNKFFLCDELYMFGKKRGEKVVEANEWITTNKYDEFKIIGDSNMFFETRESDKDITPAQAFYDDGEGFEIEKVIKARSNNKLFRINCNDNFNDLLNPDDPKFFVLRDAAPHFIECMPEIQVSKHNPMDFNTDLDNDHCFDAVKIALTDMMQKTPNKSKEDEKLKRIRERNRERII